MENRAMVVVFALVTVGAPAPASARQAIAYTADEVAPAVHVFEPNDQGVGNVVVVVSEGEALVIDATATPAAARDVLRDLRDIGVTRVVALVNTHWHDDHIWGNQVFNDSFPGLSIVAHPETVEGIREQAIPALAGQIARLHERIAERTRLLESGVAADGTLLGAEARENLEGRQALFRDAVTSLESVRPVLPNTLVRESRQFRVGGLDVSIDHVGAGHTAGDLIVRVPARGVVVVGDLITRPVPAAAGADLLSWIDVLESLGRMDWTILVPGHGEVQRDRAYLGDVLTLFRDLVDYVRDGREAGTTLEVLIESADFGGFRDRWLGDDAREDLMFQAFFVEPAIRSTYSALGGLLPSRSALQGQCTRSKISHPFTPGVAETPGVLPPTIVQADDALRAE